MGRIGFAEGKQRDWIDLILKETSLGISGIASVTGVSERTIRDWRREKYTISESAFHKLSKQFEVPIPGGVTKLDSYWYAARGARKGALKRLELYGPPGTLEGRKKGGHSSQLKRKLDPEKYRLLGCNVSKQFAEPKKSELLAEAVGIILGDGGVTDYQLKVTLNKETDLDYAKFVERLFRLVFGQQPAWYEPKNTRVVNICLSGVNLVEQLSKLGIGKGNKIKRQVDFPDWVWKKPAYQRKCVRGLMDTDGCVYFHHHTTKGVKYRNLGMCFTSHSRPLLNSVSKVFSANHIKHTLIDTGRVYIYDLEEVKKYFRIVGSSNSKFEHKLDFHLRSATKLS